MYANECVHTCAHATGVRGSHAVMIGSCLRVCASQEDEQDIKRAVKVVKAAATYRNDRGAERAHIHA